MTPKVGKHYVIEITNAEGRKWRSIGRCFAMGDGELRWETVGRDDWTPIDEFKAIREIRLR